MQSKSIPVKNGGPGTIPTGFLGPPFGLSVPQPPPISSGPFGQSTTTSAPPANFGQPSTSSVNNMAPTAANSNYEHPVQPKLKREFLHLLRTGSFSDYTIATATHTWSVHLCILGTTAGNLLPKDAAAGGVATFGSWDPTVMDRILEFVYAGDYDMYKTCTTSGTKYGTFINPPAAFKLPTEYHKAIFYAADAYAIPGLADAALTKLAQYFEGEDLGFVQGGWRCFYRGVTHQYTLPQHPGRQTDKRMQDYMNNLAAARGLRT